MRLTWSTVRWVVAGCLLLGVFGTAFAPPAGAQSGGKEINLTDAAGDVRLLTPALPTGVNTPVTESIDIQSARLFGESGSNFLIQVVMNKLISENLPPSVVQNLKAVMCFKWNGQGFAIIVPFRVPNGGILYDTKLFPTTGECEPGAAIPVVASKAVSIGGFVDLDIANGRITVSVQRATLAKVAGAAPPKTGDTLGNLRVLSYDSLLAGPSTRMDAVPDAAADGQSLTLESDTAGLGTLKAVADSNIRKISCGGRLDAPSYAFEAGGKRGIPITFQNFADATREVSFTVETASGTNWQPKIVPRLNVGPHAEIGNVTVTVIIDTPASTSHKDCAILRVRGVAKDDPANFAEALVSAIAVRPPDRDHQRLFFHGNVFARDVCSGPDTWLNTLQADPADAKPFIMMKNCKEPDYLSVQNVQFSTQLDVNPNKDLVVNTSASGKTAKVVLRMVSEHVDTRVRMSVSLTTHPREGDGDLIGDGRKDATVTSGGTDVEIPLKIGFTRDSVATGDPSRVVLSEDGLQLTIAYEPLPNDAALSEVRTAGHVTILTEGTYVDVPVWSTIKRNAADPGASGSLISLNPASELPKFAAPGAVRLFNFTVLNEGPEHDVAVFEGSFTGASGWSVQFLPSDTITLAPGERRIVQAALTPPTTANESESVLFDVVVHSQKDPTARSSVAVKVIATREGGVPQESIPSLDVQQKKGLLPAPGALEVLALVGLLGLIVGRRRGPPRHP